MKFNEQQQSAIDSNASAIQVIAGPGSGKTTVLVERIKKLLIEGVSPYQFLVITFTKKAAASLKEKLGSFLIEKDLRKMTIGTSHAFCLRVIRQWADTIGYKENLTIYDEVDQDDIVAAIIKDMDYKITAKQAIAEFDTLSYQNPDEKSEAYYIYKEYLSHLKRFNALDYDLILIKAVWILKNCPDALKYYQDRFQYLFYDEFQDLATLEHELVLTTAIPNCFVVGDPDQNIYTFRGTDIKYILEFQNNHLGCEVINLEYNYRSRPEICEAANNLIKNNKNRIDKSTISTRDDLGFITYMFYDDEAHQISRALYENIHDKINSPKDIAILVRTNRQMKPIKEALEAQNIPVQIVARDFYWQKKEIKDILAFLRVIANPRDDFSMNRILCMPYLQIGRSDLLMLRNRSIRYDDFLLNVCFNNCFRDDISMIIQLCDKIEQDKYIPAMRVFKTIINISDYIKSLRSQNLTTRLESIVSMLDKIREFEEQSPEDTSLKAFLDSISEISAIDSWDENKDAVSLMTMHCAKGLEWPVVIVAGCEESLTPMLKDSSLEGIEEERRLFYVAITRAKNELILSRSLTRNLWGNETVETKPSRFLDEMKGMTADELLNKKVKK